MGGSTLKRLVALLVWSLAVIAVDGVVITRDDGAARVQGSATVTSSTASPASGSTTAATSAEASTPSSSTSTTAVPAVSTATVPTTSVGPTSSATGDTVVAHLQGDGDTPSTAPFRVEGRWELRWHVDQSGNGVAAVVHDDSGGDQGFFLGLQADGLVDREGGCTCTLQLTPDGSSYEVDVVDLVD